MTDPVYTSLPSIVWVIQNYSTTGRKVCTLSFLGSSWNLIFSRLSDSGTQRIMLRLESSNASENLRTLKLCSYACIVTRSASHALSMTTQMTLKDGEWCVWLYNASSIVQNIGQVPDVCFSVRFYPYEVTKEQILCVEKIRLQVEEDKASCKAYLCEDIAHLYENSEQSDFELRCKELRMPVHKAVLSARSGYFAALFRSPMKENDKGYVEFQNIEPQILQHVMKYLYSGILPESALECLPEVYAVADRFDFESLKIKCASLVMESFEKEHQPNPENASSTLETEITPDSQDDIRKILIKKLFRTSEWKALFRDCPAFAAMMCKPVIMDIPKI